MSKLYTVRVRSGGQLRRARYSYLLEVRETFCLLTGRLAGAWKTGDPAQAERACELLNARYSGTDTPGAFAVHAIYDGEK